MQRVPVMPRKDGQISYTEFLGATLDLDEVRLGKSETSSRKERGDRLMRYVRGVSVSLEVPVVA